MIFYAELIILMVVDVVNPSPTSIPFRYGDGIPRVNVLVSLDQRAPRTAIRWLLKRDPEGRKRGESAIRQCGGLINVKPDMSFIDELKLMPIQVASPTTVND